MIDFTHYIKADIPVLLWGPPGSGKTETIKALAEKAGAKLFTVIGSQIDPTDLVRPVVSGEKILLAPSPWLEEIADLVADKKEVWLFLDELSCSPPAVQAALLRLVQERKCAHLDISGCKIIAAANPTEQAADGWDLPAATANRWAHVQWSVDPTEWVEGLLTGWGAGRPTTSADTVAGYISHRSDALQGSPEANGPWASPRTWDLLSRLPVDLHEQCAAELVGSASAREYLAWLSERSLPNPQDLLDGKEQLPVRSDLAYAALLSLAAYAAPKKEKHESLWSFLLKQRKDLGVQVTKLVKKIASSSGVSLETSENLMKLVDNYRCT